LLSLPGVERPLVELRYDRGTIVLAGGEPFALAAAPAGVAPPPDWLRWDPRVDRWRALARRLGDLCRWLEERGVRWVYRSARPQGFHPRVVAARALPPLRPYQEMALAAWCAAGRRGIVCLPTGSGKTRVAIHAIFSAHAPALVLVPTCQLLEQWAAALGERYSGEVGRCGDGQRDVRPITVATYASARVHIDRLGDHFDLLVADEVHHFTAEHLGEIVEMSTARRHLGLSATVPQAEEDPDGRRRLEDLFGRVAYHLPVLSLAGSYLAELEVRVVPVELTPRERAEYDELRRQFLDYYRSFASEHSGASWEDFARAASRTPRGRRAYQAFRRARELLSLPAAKLAALDHLLDRHRADPTLVFTADNRGAYEISRRFLIPAITCETGRAERLSILAGFRDGTYRALVSAKVLNEGIDVPAAAVAIIAGGGASPRQHAQRIGRILRPAAGKKSIVYEVVAYGTSEWRTSERRNQLRASFIAPAL
jgi:superfamily II DNA or RNA helicase